MKQRICIRLVLQRVYWPRGAFCVYTDFACKMSVVREREREREAGPAGRVENVQGWAGGGLHQSGKAAGCT